MALTQVDQGLLGTYAQYTGFKNRIYNGQMQIDQRNAGASVTVTNASPYTVDRFFANKDTSAATVTAQQSSTAPAGFINSLLWTTSTGSSPGVDDDNFIAQKIEGFNIADLAWGTANAATVTLSFWVRSSVTGTYGVALRNYGGARSYVASYTVNSANTFEYKTITVAGDQSGTWLTNNSYGIYLDWDTGCGTNRSTTAGSWKAGSYPGLTGGTKLVSTTGATFYLTGVQLEKGSTATSFDYRPYGAELQLCQRYYWKNGVGDNSVSLGGTGAFASSTTLQAMFQFPVTMRANPTATQSSANIADGTAGSAVTSIGTSYYSTSNAQLTVVASGGTFTSKSGGYVYAGSTSAFVAFSAEL